MRMLRTMLSLGPVLLFLCSGGIGLAEVVTINGAGASFPYPLYSQWAYQYNQLSGVKLNYQSIGSGGGIAQIKAGTVDFGASDAPLQAKELEEAGLVQFPMIMGGIVPVVNVSGIKAGQLKLTPEVLADIFLGKITKWNDPALQKDNKELNLPNKAIAVVHRADGSGTTWIFTDYLSKISPEWKQRVGVGKSVSWPTGIGGKGNEGVANYVQRAPGAIGYVEYAYAIQNRLAYALLKNQEGNFVEPTNDTFQAAAAGADWKNSPGYYVVLTNEPGKNSWPITGASFILIHRQLANPTTGKAMLKFFDWCYRHGDKTAVNLQYVPIPISLVELVENTWKEQLTANGKPIWP